MPNSPLARLRRWWSRPCGFRAGTHARLRQIDREGLWPAIVRQSESETAAAMAWGLFLALPGQDHWRCACAMQEAEHVHND